MHITFQLYDVLKVDSTVVIYVLINMLYHPRCQATKYFKISKHEVHEYASGLTSTPKAELFCSCKRRKIIGQNKVKICKIYSQNLQIIESKFANYRVKILRF